TCIRSATTTSCRAFSTSRVSRLILLLFFSSRRRHTSWPRDWSSDVCSSDLGGIVVLGGTHTSFLPEEGLEHADFVIRGEGEFAFQELVDAIQRGDGFEKILNLSYRQDGRVVSNPERPKIPNLDVNPIPDYTLISGWKPGGVISVATSRGCPFSCTFCSVPGMYGHAFRTHSIDRVLQELTLHKGNLYTFFADDIFTAKNVYRLPLCRVSS